MSKINLKQLIADREAGTDGPWGDDRKEHEQPYEPIKIKNGFRPICSVYMDDAPVPDFNSAQIANARRIARLPDLEAAFLEAVETLRVIAAEAYVAVDEGYPGTWRNVAVERIDIARAFLERNVNAHNHKRKD